MLPLWELGYGWGWLNAITADLSIAQVAQGQACWAPGRARTAADRPAQEHALFFILTARL